jgi:hypothetical protein
LFPTHRNAGGFVDFSVWFDLDHATFVMVVRE